VQHVAFVLDVDGTLLASNPRPGFASADVTVHGWPITVYWDPAVIERLRALVGRPGVTLLWLTTWRNEVDGVLRRLLELPEGRILVEPNDGVSRASRPKDALGRPWWKADAVANDLALRSARLVVWADDDLDVDTDVATEVAARIGAPLLPVSPDESTGLTVVHLDHIEEWLAARPA